MRIMAVDNGDVRTGVAVSDASATLAGEAWVITETNEKKKARRIIDEAAARGVSVIVIGHPKNMNGTVGQRALLSEKLAESIRAESDFKVILWDERMTTMSANRILTETGKRGNKRKKTIDAVAASLILESYLSSL